MEILRELEDKDIEQINAIWKRQGSHYSIPDQNRNIIIDEVVVTEDDKVLAYGMVKLYAEAVIVLDHSLPAGQKVRAFKMLVQDAITASREYGMEALHIFSKDEDFAELMKKHYGFEDCPFKAIVLNLENGDGI